MTRKIVIIIIVSMVFITFLLTYLFFDPAGYDIFPKCQFLMLTGYKCPGCGSQRAIHALLNGNFIEAVKFNAIFMLSLPILGAYIFGELTKTRYRRFYRAINSKKAIYSLLIMYIAWWVVRNIFNW